MTPEKHHRRAPADSADGRRVHRRRGAAGHRAARAEGLGAQPRADQEVRRLGLLGTNIPEAYGGVDLDKISTLVVSRADRRARVVRRHLRRAGQPHASCRSTCSAPRRRSRSTCPGSSPGEMVGAYCLSESGLGLRRARRQDQGDEAGRRQLRALRREDVDHQRRLRRRLHRLRQGRRRALHRLHRRAGVAGRVERQGRAQAGPARLVDDAGHPAGREGAGRRGARRDRQGPQGGVQRAQLRPLQAGRDVLGRRQERRSAKRRSTRPRASSSACRSPPSAPSSTSSAR